MCNDRNSQKIRSLANYCFDLRFQRPRVEQIKVHHRHLCTLYVYSFTWSLSPCFLFILPSFLPLSFSFSFFHVHPSCLHLSSPPSLLFPTSSVHLLSLRSCVSHTQCVTLNCFTFIVGCYDEHCIQGGAQNSTSGHGPDYNWCKPRCKTGRSALNSIIVLPMISREVISRTHSYTCFVSLPGSSQYEHVDSQGEEYYL